MNSSMCVSTPVSRRAALKAFGASAVTLATSMFAVRAYAAEPKDEAAGVSKEKAPAQTAPPPPTGPFTLPALGYAYEALEPVIDTATMQLHHKRHHQAYINNANIALKDHPELHSKSAEQMLREIKKLSGPLATTVRNNVGGHANHTLFWDILTPGGPKEPKGSLGGAIERDFSNYGSMVVKLSEACASRFGSGWAWLCVYNKKLSIFSTANQDSPYMDGATPILGIDVWEHAYYLKYQNKRADYVKGVVSLINWDKVAERYKAAMG